MHTVLNQVQKNVDIWNTVPKKLIESEPFLHSCAFFSFGDEVIFYNKQHHSIDSMETVFYSKNNIF